MAGYVVKLKDGRGIRFSKEPTEEQIKAAISQIGDSPSFLEQTVSNIPSSAIKTGESIFQAIRHPIDTAKSVGNLLLGTSQKLIPGRQEEEIYPEGLIQGLKERYGSIENLKNTIKTDPVGALMDASGVVSGGAAALSGAGKLGRLSSLSKAGRVVSAIGEYSDPLSLSLKAGAGALGGVVSGAGALTTGTGKSLGTMFKAGAKGGKAEEAAIGTMRGIVTGDKIVDDAVGSLQVIKNKRADEYVKELKKISQNKQDIDFIPIWQEFNKKLQDFNVKTSVKNGKIEYDFSRSPLNKQGVSDLQEVTKIINDWGNEVGDLTPFGLDILKRKLADFYSESAEGRAFTEALRSKVKNQIVKSVPEYGQMTQKYEDASNLIKDIAAEAGLKKTTPSGTTLRKLQQTLRDNFDLRKEFVEELDKAGNKHLIEQIAGEQLSSLLPKGLMRGVAGAEIALALSKFISPKTLALLPITSPRIMGEIALKAGQGVRANLSPFIQSLLQSGRIKESKDKSK